MRILITNDDGILAPGIEALYRAVADLGTVDVVAPDDSQSAIGHAISVKIPMAVRRVHVNNAFHGWSVGGRPADCVKLAMIELLEQRPDFVLSGINAGANTGVNVLYSGTVAGAMEAALYGIPSMAISLKLSDELDFHTAGRVARRVFEHFVAAKPRPGTCLSVNIPALDGGEPKGVRVCPHVPLGWQEHYRKTTEPDGHQIYWLDGQMPDHSDHPESDMAAVHEGYVSITPLQADLTDHALVKQAANWNWPTSFNNG